MKTLQRLELLKDLIQEAVDRGASSVEQIHQYIADLPFEGLDRMGLLDPDGSELRQSKTRSIGLVYDAIRRVNQEVGELLSDQFENLEDGGRVAEVLRTKEPREPGADGASRARAARPKARPARKPKAGSRSRSRR